MSAYQLQHEPHRKQQVLSRQITHDLRCEKLIAVNSGFAPACREQAPSSSCPRNYPRYRPCDASYPGAWDRRGHGFTGFSLVLPTIRKWFVANLDERSPLYILFTVS